MKKVYIGIDVSSKTCAAAAIDVRGHLLAAVEFRTTEYNLIRFIQEQGGRTNVLIEEGELACWVMRTLLPHTESIDISDPRRNAWIAKAARKDDRTDALKLAELARLGSYSPVYHPESEEMVAFKIVVKNYDRIARRTATVKNQIKAHFRCQGIMTTGTRVFSRKGRDEAISRVNHPEMQQLLKQEFALLDYLIKEKVRAKSQVSRMSKKFPVIERFRKIPGIDIILASRFVAYVANPYRFNKRELWSFSCLGVASRESAGSSLSREHLDRAGNGTLKDLSRKAFCGAMSTRSTNGIKMFYRHSFSRTGNATHSRLNAQRKILAMMLAMWRYGTEYSDDLFMGKRGY
jgi:transposase